MGGSTGGIIVRERSAQALSDPTVHGQLPATMVSGVDAVLAKDPCDWDSVDCDVMGRAFHWALCNL